MIRKNGICESTACAGGAGAGRVLGRQAAFDPTSGKYIGYQWFDNTPYSATGPEQFGNCSAQGPVRGPGFADVDLSIQKNFPVTERVRIQWARCSQEN